MDLSSASKRTGKIILIVLILAACLLILLFPFLGRLFIMSGLVSGPYDHPNSVWVSNDPEIYLQVSPSGTVEDSICYVVADGIKIQTNMYVQPDREWVLIQPKKRTPDSPVNLIMGRLKDCTNDEVVFEVLEDELFSGEYQEISLILMNERMFKKTEQG